MLAISLDVLTVRTGRLTAYAIIVENPNRTTHALRSYVYSRSPENR